MVAFIDIRLPTQVEINAVEIDDDFTEVVETWGQWEVRNSATTQSLRRWELSFPTGKYDNATILAVIRLYKAARGKLSGWRLKSPIDNSASAEAFGTGDGATTIFNLRKNYTAGSETHQRRITRPVSSISIYKDAVLQVSGYSVNYGTGVVTFSVAPANGVALTWTGSFDVPVRFDSPLQATALDIKHMHIDTLTLRELREA